MRNIRVGMIGCGVVGQGVLRLLAENAANLEGRLDGHVQVRRIAVRDASKTRGPHGSGARVTTDPNDVLDDPELDVVVELMGGVEPAGSFVRRALEQGKPVVTANKALLAERGHELIELAERRGVDLYFEAAVAGGIPVMRVLREALASDRIVVVRGIVNGTSNYILSQMQASGMAFGDALALAQRAGYAEADPSLDIGGGDAAHKLILLATLAYGVKIDPSCVPTEGIDRVKPVDIEFARRFGFAIKPLAIARALSPDTIDLRVHPALVPRSSPLAHVDGALNAVQIEGAALGPCFLSGQGAGALPTAVSVVSDIVDVGRNLRSESAGRVPQRAFMSSRLVDAKVRDVADHVSRFYLRFHVRDESGVLGRLATTLGEHAVSIEQMVQEGRSREEPVAVVLLTHPAREGDVRAALATIDAFEVVVEPTLALSIEEG